MNVDFYKNELLYRKAQEKKLLGAFEKKLADFFRASPAKVTIKSARNRSYYKFY